MNDILDFVERHPRLFVLSGAGISTDSGIPCYRDREGQRTGRSPILLQEFLKSDYARRRYWARSLIGWPVVAGAQPNAAHHAVRALASRGRVHRLVTQNVDGLHARAGNADVIELHGNIGRVRCLVAAQQHARADVQRLLEAANPAFAGLTAPAVPDGDAHIEDLDFGAFDVPGCTRCGGRAEAGRRVFRRGRAAAARRRCGEALEASDAMLVLGSSLMVYSGYRFCEWAHRAGKPIAAINIGRTRADPLLALKVEQSCAVALERAHRKAR